MWADSLAAAEADLAGRCDVGQFLDGLTTDEATAVRASLADASIPTLALTVAIITESQQAISLDIVRAHRDADCICVLPAPAEEPTA